MNDEKEVKSILNSAGLKKQENSWPLYQVRMINLFEYQNKVDIQDSFEGLEGFLDEIWNSREKHSF